MSDTGCKQNKYPLYSLERECPHYGHSLTPDAVENVNDLYCIRDISGSCGDCDKCTGKEK